MKREVSIRFRLTTWYALVLAAGLLTFAVLIWISLRHALIHQIDESLASRAQSFELFLRSELAETPPAPLKEELEEFCKGLPNSSHLEVHRIGGDFDFSFPVNAPISRATNSSARPGYTEIRSGGHTFRVFRREIMAQNGAYTLEINAPLDTVQDVLNVLRTMLLSLIPAVLLAASLGGYWLSRRALKPVDALTAAARSIGVDDFSSRLSVPQTGDELQRLAEAWNTMLSRLEAAVNKILHFAADASHELRTPLSIIQTSAELALRRPRTSDEYRESLGQIEAESARMTQLVENLLLLARSDASATEMPTEPLDLTEVLETACSELQAIADFRNITIHHSLPEASLLIKGNRPALQRLFLVLLDNALKYSEPGGDVNIILRSTSNGPEVTIRDSGPGISAQDLPHIFERFYRSDKAGQGANGGHGIGLALAESVARRHGAKISVESSLNQGAEFRVLFGKKCTLTRSEQRLVKNAFT